jgi:hypothetical protein
MACVTTLDALSPACGPRNRHREPIISLLFHGANQGGDFIWPSAGCQSHAQSVTSQIADCRKSRGIAILTAWAQVVAGSRAPLLGALSFAQQVVLGRTRGDAATALRCRDAQPLAPCAHLRELRQNRRVQKTVGKHVVSGSQDSCYRPALDSAKAQKFESLVAYVADHGAQPGRRKSAT